MWINKNYYEDLKIERRIYKDASDQWKKNYENLRDSKDNSVTFDALYSLNRQQAEIIEAKDKLIESLLFSLNAKEKLDEV